MPFVTHNAIGKHQREKTKPERGREGVGEMKKNPMPGLAVSSLRLFHFTFDQFDWCSLSVWEYPVLCLGVFFFVLFPRFVYLHSQDPLGQHMY